MFTRHRPKAQLLPKAPHSADPRHRNVAPTESLGTAQVPSTADRNKFLQSQMSRQGAVHTQIPKRRALQVPSAFLQPKHILLPRHCNPRHNCVVSTESLGTATVQKTANPNQISAAQSRSPRCFEGAKFSKSKAQLHGSDTITKLRTTHSVRSCRREGLTEGKTPDSGQGPSVLVPVPESEATRQDDRYHRQ